MKLLKFPIYLFALILAGCLGNMGDPDQPAPMDPIPSIDPNQQRPLSEKGHDFLNEALFGAPIYPVSSDFEASPYIAKVDVYDLTSFIQRNHSSFQENLKFDGPTIFVFGVATTSEEGPINRRLRAVLVQEITNNSTSMVNTTDIEKFFGNPQIREHTKCLSGIRSPAHPVSPGGFYATYTNLACHPITTLTDDVLNEEPDPLKREFSEEDRISYNEKLDEFVAFLQENSSSVKKWVKN